MDRRAARRLCWKKPASSAAHEWVLAEGADAAAMSRSVPLAKIMDDAIIALYQNGERLRPENGYPLRLFLPGYEGNMSVKWLRRLKVVSAGHDDARRDFALHRRAAERQSVAVHVPDGREVGHHEPVDGARAAGAGCLRDHGARVVGPRARSRASRCLPTAAAAGQTPRSSEPVLSKSFTRFRMAWRWNGGPAVLMSRAIDDTGAVQPTRASLVARARRAPELSQQRHSGVERRGGRRGEQCLRVTHACERCSPR